MRGRRPHTEPIEPVIGISVSPDWRTCWRNAAGRRGALREGVQLTLPPKIFIPYLIRDMPTAVEAARQQVAKRGEAV